MSETISSRSTRLRFALLALLLSATVGAQTPPVAPAPMRRAQPMTLPGNPYGAIVPVDDESASSRDKGLRLALIQVLKGAVGGTDVATSPILGQAPRLVQKYGFVRDPGAATPLFKAEFDPAAVDAALRAQGLPVFGLNPEVIENWVVQVSGLRSASDYSRVLRHFSRIRGVRKLDVDALRDDQLSLRMVVEGGLDAARERALKSGLLEQDPMGNYVIAGR